LEKDTRHRRYNITINNPGAEWAHGKIRAVLDGMNLKYWCMADEIGEQGTPHTHIYLVAAVSAIRFSTMKGLFPTFVNAVIQVVAFEPYLSHDPLDL